MGIQSTDITQTANIGIPYTADDESWTINPGVTVSSRDNYAVFSDKNGSVLINHGNLFSGNFAATGFTGDNADITNNGNIGSFQTGIYLTGNGIDIVNHGTVTSYLTRGVWFDTGSANATLGNDGEIFGSEYGVYDLSFPGATINNSGLIHSDNVAVFAPVRISTQTIFINNLAGGRIEGDAGAIISEPRLVLNNSSTIQGGIGASQFDDVIMNKGKILGQVSLSAGDDVFNGNGGSSVVVDGGFDDDMLSGGAAADQLSGFFGNDTLTGRDGNDRLFDNTGNDVLNGGAGNDTLVGGPDVAFGDDDSDVLNGGTGRDLLTGGDDRDIFDFNSKSESVKGANRDVITDFNRSELDRIDLRTIDADTSSNPGNDAFKFIGTAAFKGGGGELRFIDHGTTCTVQGDINGDKVADFEIRVNIASLNSGDFLL